MRQLVSSILVIVVSFTCFAEVSKWSLNKIDHPILNELMVRNVYVDHKKRIYLATDSGVYRYSNKQLIKLDERFNGTAKAFNGPVSGVKVFDSRYLIIRVFPNRNIFFDTLEDLYVTHPFGKFLEKAHHQSIFDASDGQKIVDILNTHEGVFTYNQEDNDLELILSSTQISNPSAHQQFKDSPLYLVDITKLNNFTSEVSATENYQVHIYVIDINGVKLMSNFLSKHESHVSFFVGNRLVLASPDKLRLFENQKLIEELSLITLCDSSYANFSLRDNANLTWPAMPRGDSRILLFSPCGMHEYNLLTSKLRLLYKAEDSDIGTWFKGSRSSLQNVSLILTKTDLYLLDGERFERISAFNTSSQGGTTYSIAKIDENQYLVAKGTPGLYLATNTVSNFQSLSQQDLVQLTGASALRHIIKDKSDNFWLSSQTNGLIQASFNSGQWVKHNHFLPGIHVRSLYTYKDDILVATEGAGLWLLDQVNQEINLLDPLSEYAGVLNFLRIKVAGLDTEQLLIGTTNGLLLFDLERKTFIKKLTGLEGNIWAMAQDYGSNIWVASHDTGLHKLDPEFNIIETYGSDMLFDSVLLDIEIDDNNQPVLASWGAGVLYRKEGQLVFSQLSTKDGLLSDTVQSIIRTETGEYWISTDLGLARFSLCQTE